MATIAQNLLFSWKDLENDDDLLRLKYVLDNIPDSILINKLSNIRMNGRNDYPITAVWNSILAGIVFQHNSIESLRRELLRNFHLRILCGFDPYLPAKYAVPKSYNYTRFLKNLFKLEDEIEHMFHELIKQVKDLLPDFGSFLAHDGKAIQTVAKKKKQGYKPRDGRRDVDADFGTKEKLVKRSDGTLWKKITNWFGYKLHLIVDANYELPIAFEVTKASLGETPIAHKLIDKLNEDHPDIIKDAEFLASDRGNDDEKLIKKCWREYRIKPIIDIRNMWKDKDETKGLSSGINAVYNYKGDIFCVCPKTGDLKTMNYAGFEKDRNGHKYRCPNLHCGVECKGKQECEIFKRKYVRISLKENERIFTPVARSSYKWKKLYKKRTSVERVNSRIDEFFCFEKHFIRGLKKMKLKLSLSFCVMLSMAIGKIKDNQLGHIRSLVKAA